MPRYPTQILRNIEYFSSFSTPQVSALLSRPLLIFCPWKPEARVARPNAATYSTKTSPDGKHVRDCHFEYNWIDGAESLEKYGPGGYHPIMIGDVLRE
ncbi:hypothetical protein BDV25DRAFT_149818 [Aspergillus avenaceus]|uniref:Uncharacterized protein n=1 Tax=Aspergillus avenaceus TaxID=36643 RepID=A0A5N6U3H3_ASPAV|nr:hypothetical protein BDV25DRAFT_149818 [Aspergillus avenaceus]